MDIELRDPANIGGRIAHIRELRGMTITELAAAVGIKQPSMSDIESGETKSPSAITLLRLSAVLGANPWWIMTGEGSPTSEVDVDEAEWLEVFRSLDSVGKRRLILAAAKAMAEEQVPGLEDLGDG